MKDLVGIRSKTGDRQPIGLSYVIYQMSHHQMMKKDLKEYYS